jgi:tRNA modification GTPase
MTTADCAKNHHVLLPPGNRRAPIGMAHEDTIFAVATGTGRTALAVIRISGRGAGESLRKIAGQIPAPRRVALAYFRNPTTGDPIDRGLVIWFPGPASFTGEDCAEFHIHGGRAVLRGMLDALSEVPGFRLAEPGEFARRAFGNGKMDLSAIEGLGDLIEAETEVQRRQALLQMNGRLGAHIESWRKVILEARALVEAEIDFADEGEAPIATLLPIVRMIAPVISEIDQILESGRSGEIVRTGFSVVLAGPPNSGKSTLLNAIAERDVAIVTEHAGTTRDVIEVRLDLDGMLVVLADTAGLRESEDPVEREGIVRTRRRIDEADLVLWLADSGNPVEIPDEFRRDGLDILRVRTKIDLDPTASPNGHLKISALTGHGMPELMALIKEKAGQAMRSSEPALISRERHRRALVAAKSALQAVADGSLPIELAAEHLRAAGRSLESIIGRIDVEQVLGEIFARFCMGK